MVYEPRIHIDDLPAERGALLQDTLRQTARSIERELLHRIVVFETTSLPPAGRSALEHKQRGASAVVHDTFQQGTQNFFLSGAGVDGRNRAQEIGGTGVARFRYGGRAQILRQLVENAAHKFLAQLREVSLEYLGYHTLYDRFDFVPVCHVLAVNLGERRLLPV
jgi:hypothetical protein